MTNLEAIDQLCSLVLSCKNLIRRNGSNEIYKEIYENDIEALRTAITALEKQIPKTVIDVEDGILCPNCKLYVCTYGKVGRKNHCDNCGQALDWGDGNDKP